MQAQMPAAIFMLCGRVSILLICDASDGRCQRTQQSRAEHRVPRMLPNFVDCASHAVLCCHCTPNSVTFLLARVEALSPHRTHVDS